MSYDLFLEGGPGKRIDKKSYAAYFKDRRNYDLGNGQALYQNQDTGVYFIFDEPQEGMVAFNLNYFRPHVFGLEAAVELEAFAKAFAATATDESGGEGPFQREKFLRAWNEGNRFGYRAMVKEQDEPPHTWPSKRIREVWEWNYARPAEEDGDDQPVFIPGIFAVAVDGQAWSIAIWPPECPILIPAVDALLVPLAQSGKASEDLALVKWEEVLPVVKPYQVKGAGTPRYRLEFEAWPAEVAAFLARKRQAAKAIEGIALDQVLDRELVEEANQT